jgi:hypothetical protein
MPSSVHTGIEFVAEMQTAHTSNARSTIEAAVIKAEAASATSQASGTLNNLCGE